MEIFCADQREISPRFCIGETKAGAFQPTFDHISSDGPGADACGLTSSYRFTLRRCVRMALLFVTNDEMDDAIGRGDEEAVKIFPQLFDFIAARDSVDLQK